VEVVSPIDYRFAGLSPRLWSEVVEADMKKETIKLLWLFDPSIDDVDIVSTSGGQAIVSMKHKKLGHAPLTTFGDGLLRVFTFATKIAMVKDGLLLIDELEMAIHTNALEKTFDWLVKACTQNNVQLFATTHSLEAVDAIIYACKDEPVDLVTYRLQKSGEQIVAKRFNKRVITRMRENLGLEVR
jgi:AAA15 family ATPase/GTPase